MAQTRKIAFDRAVVVLDILRLFFLDLDLERLHLTVVNEKVVNFKGREIPLQLLQIKRPPRMTMEIYAVVVTIKEDEWQEAFLYADRQGTFFSLRPNTDAVVLK